MKSFAAAVSNNVAGQPQGGAQHGLRRYPVDNFDSAA
jgi:hypothetical protein